MATKKQSAHCCVGPTAAIGLQVTHPGVLELLHVGYQVVLDALEGTRQRRAPDQQHQHQHVRGRRCHVQDLQTRARRVETRGHVQRVWERGDVQGLHCVQEGSTLKRVGG